MQALFAFLPIGRKILLIVAMTGIWMPLFSQIKWDGEGIDGLWSTAANWVGNIVPSDTDDVLLDHSVFSGNYAVLLPAGGTAVTVRTLTILPATGQTIEVILPVSNTAIPGFSAIGSVYGLVIHSGGTFRNSSGASAGTPVNISDSIKINNGGFYIHNSARAHAANVTVLSKVPGTEQGNFEFDVPGGAGYTVSIAGRVYGNMILSATAAGGTKSYTSTGITTVNINGQFRINPGVNYSLNFNGGFIIHGDFIHQGNVFDISGGSNSNRISLRKNLIQSGIITESGTGLPVVEFDGPANQNMSVTGTITENLLLRINNAAGITLQTPVSISYAVELMNGKVRTTPVNILIMQDNTGYAGGSVNSFIEGPMRKIGDDNFIFPVGKQGDYAPVSITGTGGSPTDVFDAEYFFGDPTIIFGSLVEDPPIIRISRLEYWKLERMAGMSPKKITLNIRSYSNATLLEKLVVSRWEPSGSIWKNAENTAYSGIASGTITSADTESFGVFTIGSTVIDQNPLPIHPFSFQARNEGENVLLSWRVDPGIENASFEILRSADKIAFDVVKKINAHEKKLYYQYTEKISAPGVYYYQLKLTQTNGTTRFSSIAFISYRQNRIELVTASPVITNTSTNLTIRASGKGLLQLTILNAGGKAVRRISTIVYGPATFVLDLSTMPAGMYYVSGIANGVRTKTLRIMKL